VLVASVPVLSDEPAPDACAEPRSTRTYADSLRDANWRPWGNLQTERIPSRDADDVHPAGCHVSLRAWAIEGRSAV